MAWKDCTPGSPCPICGKTSWCGSDHDEHGRLLAHCHGSDMAPSGWRQIKRTKAGGVVFVQDGPGDPDAATPERRAAERDQELRKKRQSAERARALFEAALPLDDPGAQRGRDYLKSRGVPIDRLLPLAWVRFHPAAPHYAPGGQGEPGTMPALVCAAVNAAGGVVAVQRIYLDPSHPHRRMAGEHAKKMLGPIKGAAVRLEGEGHDTLLLCEGIETGMALRAATGLTVWACASTTGLRQVDCGKIDPRPSRFIVCADRDAPHPKHPDGPGQEAAAACAQRLALLAPADIALPPLPEGVTLGRAQGETKSVDWLDVFVQRSLGPERLREMVLGARGAQVRPETPSGPGKRGGVDGRVRWPERRVASDEKTTLVRNDPNDMAVAYMRDKWTDDQGRLRLRMHQGEWHGHDGRRWTMLEHKYVRRDIRMWLRRCKMLKLRRGGSAANPDDYEEVPVIVGQHLSADVEDGAAAMAGVGGGLQGPTDLFSWIDSRGRVVDGPIVPASVIACASGLVDADAWCRGERRVAPHTPQWFSAVCVPFALPDWAAPGDDASAWAHAPLYKGFIQHTFGEDLDDLREDAVSQIESWHEWAGYCMTLDTSFQQIVAVVGDPGTGKGTLCRVHRALVGGDGQVASPTLMSLGGEFGLQPLLGKSNAIMADVRQPRMDIAMVGCERMQLISGEDPVSVRRKTVYDLGDVKLRARFTLAMNEVIKLPDDAGAFKRRFVWFHTPNVATKIDRRLGERLEREMPAIFVLALNGLLRARSRGRVAQPATARDVAGEFTEASQQLLPFLEDCCMTGNTEWEEPVQAVYEAYQRWAKRSGAYELPLSDFGKKLNSMGLGVKKRRRRSGVNDMVSVYQGLRVVETSKTQLDLPPV